jgi:hypothetical protein
MSERVRGGWEGEKAQRIFDTTQNFDQILNLVINAQPGTFTNSSGKEINVQDVVSVKTSAEKGNLVPVTMIECITKKNGLREAVVRAMAPRFAAMESLTQIKAWLDYAKTQEDLFQSALGENGQPLKIMFDSSGNPLNLAQTAQNLWYIIDFVGKYPGYEMPNSEQFFNNFTSNYGLREAVKRSFVIARSGGPV